VAIPLFDTEAQLAEVRGDVQAAVQRVLESGRFILGPEVEAFEQELAGYLGVTHVIGVANGTDAITIALKAAGIEPGDDVVVPSFTFYASAEAIPHVGARPVFCDVDPDTFCVTPETVERALTPDTRAVVAVDLFGRMAPVDRIREALAGRDIVLIEDAAQAAGARLRGRRAGALGDAGTFSFFPSKNLFCLGDGGAIATDDDAIAEQARILRFHGSRDKATFDEIGWNSRLDALQAAVLRVTLAHLDGWNERRRDLAAAYADAGAGDVVGLPAPAEDEEPVHHLFVTRASDPDSLAARLREQDIGARSYYRTPVHRQPAMAGLATGDGLPGTEQAARSNLALPMGPTLGAGVAEAVAAVLRSGS
jgi:dTDP-4-amino-4,6-dideoxygalactose transaminase